MNNTASHPDTVSDKAMQPRWYVMRAYKCENVAEEKLAALGYEFFIPKHYAIRVYHGVKTKRLLPAIPGLVFVHAHRTCILEFKKQYNFLQFVMWKKSTGLEYLTVPDAQMANFMAVARHYEEDITYFAPGEIDIKKGQHVRIHGGKFDGVTGYFMRVQGKRQRRVVVMLDGITAITACVTPDLVEVIE